MEAKTYCHSAYLKTILKPLYWPVQLALGLQVGMAALEVGGPVLVAARGEEAHQEAQAEGGQRGAQTRQG